MPHTNHDGSIDPGQSPARQARAQQDFQRSKNDHAHPAKYLHRANCMVYDIGECDCDRIPNPARMTPRKNSGN